MLKGNLYLQLLSDLDSSISQIFEVGTSIINF